MYFW